MTIFNFIKANQFFKHYAPGVAQWSAKIRGVNWKGHPTHFTIEDKKIIRQGVKKMIKEKLK